MGKLKEAYHEEICRMFDDPDMTDLEINEMLDRRAAELRQQLEFAELPDWMHSQNINV